MKHLPLILEVRRVVRGGLFASLLGVPLTGNALQYSIDFGFVSPFWGNTGNSDFRVTFNDSLPVDQAVFYLDDLGNNTWGAGRFVGDYTGFNVGDSYSDWNYAGSASSVVDFASVQVVWDNGMKRYVGDTYDIQYADGYYGGWSISGFGVGNIGGLPDTGWGADLLSNLDRMSEGTWGYSEGPQTRIEARPAGSSDSFQSSNLNFGLWDSQDSGLYDIRAELDSCVADSNCSVDFNYTRSAVFTEDPFGPGGVSDTFVAHSGRLDIGDVPEGAILPESINPATGEYIFPQPEAGNLWFDPEVAEGYTYEILASGEYFTGVNVPYLYGDGIFGLLIYDDTTGEFTLFGEFSTGEWVDLTGLDVSKFKILGIETDAAVDPNDPNGFVTGLLFSGNGSPFSMTPEVVLLPDPEPSMPAELVLNVQSGEFQPAMSQVPLPPAAYLMGCGLLWLFGFSRGAAKRRN